LSDPTNSTPRPAQRKWSIGPEVDLFVKQVDGLADTLPLASVAIQGASELARQHFEKFLAEECTAIAESDKKKATYEIDPGKVLHFRRLVARAQKASQAAILVPRSLLVSLVSQYDAFLGRLVRQLFAIRPEILNSSANSLTFSQLTQFGSLDAARDYVVDKEVESLLRKSHTEQFEWLETKFGLPLRTNLKVWPTFVELTERRNLFVHTGGVVSHQYLEVCSKSCCKIDAELCAGKVLSVSRDYFEVAHECLFEIGIKLAHVLWRKLDEGDRDRADSNLISVCYELLTEGRYRLAREICDFSTETLKKHSSEEVRLTMVVNRAQAYKWSGDEDSARKIIAAEDWSATSLKFRLAQSVIADDFKVAIDLMRQIGPKGELLKEMYREWPLFREIGKTREFAQAFQEIFGEPLNTITLKAESKPDSNQTVN
jgi:hypothetical protein